MPLLFHNLNLLTLPSFSLFLHQFVLQKGNQVIGISHAFLWYQGYYIFLQKKSWVLFLRRTIFVYNFIKFSSFDQRYYILVCYLEYTYFTKFTLCSSGLRNRCQSHPTSPLFPFGLSCSSELDHKVKVMLISFFCQI